MDSTSAVRIIADIWADLVRNDEDAKAQQLLKTAMEHPGVDKETLREALLDTVRQMIRGAPRRTESDDNSWKEVRSDIAPWAVLEPFASSGCKEFCLHKMSDGSVDPACAMSVFRNSVSDGRVVELDMPTLADWTQQHPDGLGWNLRVSDDAGGYGAICRHGRQRAGSDRAKQRGAGGRR